MKLQANISEEFNEFSKNYTSDMVACVPHYRELLSGFENDFPLAFNPKKILDLGCGNGNVTAQLIKKFPKAQFTLLDASNKMLELCEKQFHQFNIRTVESYFQDFDFENNRFDIIAAGFSVHHCVDSDKKSIFKKIYKSLNPKGAFLCSDLMVDRNSIEHESLISFWKDFVLSNFSNEDKWNWLMQHYDEYDNPHNLTNHLEWLQEAGFKDFNLKIYDQHWVHLKAFKSL